MKKQMILFGLISIFAGSSAAWACDKCSVDLKVYDKILNRGCSLNYQTITNSGAQSIARLAAEGRIDVDAFMDIWNKTCDYDSSLDQAKEVKLGQLNLDVYDRIKGKSCSLNYQTITNSGAREVAELAQRHEISVDGFEDIWSRTCDYRSALQAARDIKNRALDQRAYDDLLGHGCRLNYQTITDPGAQEIARLVALGKINLHAFFDVWDKTCNFDSAKALATCDVVGSNLDRVIGVQDDKSRDSTIYEGTNTKARFNPATAKRIEAQGSTTALAI